MLGFLYVTGTGIPKDYEEGVKWLKLAADQEFDYAQRLLKEITKSSTIVGKEL